MLVHIHACVTDLLVQMSEFAADSLNRSLWPLLLLPGFCILGLVIKVSFILGNFSLHAQLFVSSFMAAQVSLGLSGPFIFSF